MSRARPVPRDTAAARAFRRPSAGRPAERHAPPARAALLAVFLAVPLGGCLARGGAITSVVPIDAGEGATPVARLVPDGRSGVIIEGSLAALDRPDAVMVLLPRLAPSRGWDVVGVADPLTGEVSPTVAGRAGEREAVRFVRAKVGGLPATLLFVAHGGGRPGERAAFDIDVYRLATDGSDGSGLPAVFDPLRHIVTEDRYCTPAAALAEAPGAVGRGDEGDGCGMSPTA